MVGLLESSGWMLTILHCAGPPPTRKDFLVQNVNRVKVEESSFVRLRQRLSPGLVEMRLPWSWWRWRIREGEQGRASFNWSCRPSWSIVARTGQMANSYSWASSQRWASSKTDTVLNLWHCWFIQGFWNNPQGKERDPILNASYGPGTMLVFMPILSQFILTSLCETFFIDKET